MGMVLMVVSGFSPMMASFKKKQHIKVNIYTDRSLRNHLDNTEPTLLHSAKIE